MVMATKSLPMKTKKWKHQFQLNFKLSLLSTNSVSRVGSAIFYAPLNLHVCGVQVFKPDVRVRGWLSRENKNKDWKKCKKKYISLIGNCAIRDSIFFIPLVVPWQWVVASSYCYLWFQVAPPNFQRVSVNNRFVDM